mgnify:CR=1 FL=1
MLSNSCIGVDLQIPDIYDRKSHAMLSLTIMRYSALFACVGCAAGLCRGMWAGGGRVGWPGLAVCVWATGRIPLVLCCAGHRLSNTFTGHPHCLLTVLS